MKRKGDAPATKADLDRFATKDDLKEFAKTDALDRLERIVKNMAVQVVGFSSELSRTREDFSSALARMESRLVDRMASFMAKSVTVERDQFWLIHRMDKIEDRVSQIEKRQP